MDNTLSVYKDIIKALCYMMRMDEINPELFLKRFVNEFLKESKNPIDEVRDLKDYLDSLNKKGKLYWGIMTHLSYLMMKDNIKIALVISHLMDDIKKI